MLANHPFPIIAVMSAALVTVSCAQQRYFGVYAYDCPQQCLQELRSYSNVVALRVSVMGNPRHDVDQIKQAKAAGMKVIFVMFPGFLEEPNITLEQQKKWDDWVATIKPYKDDIVAFNPYDEPYLRAFTRVGGDFRMGHAVPLVGGEEKLATSIQGEKSKLELAGRRIQADLPGIPLIDNEVAEMTRHGGFELPSNYSWFALDCYKDFDDCYGKPIPWYYEQLAKHLSIGQKLAAVVPGFVKKPAGEPITDSDVNYERRQIDKFTNLIKADPRFVAVLVWSYLNKPEQGSVYHGISVIGQNIDPNLAHMSHELGVK
jgi:hypothetical protein